ncbi:DUF3108 domain-containing protein [Paraglaciecola sp. 20A4]|uniref:DUF3108 domain-containing protein n=1 Tax=Paraglaciecola sp. 20A4 TaxID=2687288 RepID=UPI00140B224B|nr:DUF3108 domain-containing protein [Paraglaciecola sp. 20A4]
METKYQARVMRLISKRWLSGLLFIVGSVAQASALPSFDAEYTAFRYGKKLGYALLSVENIENNTYRMEYHSKVSLFFLSDKRTEISDFAFIDNKIVPKNYRYSRTGTGSNKSTKIVFDSDKAEIVVDDKQGIAWHDQFDNQLYRLDMQQKLAQGQKEFSYSVVNYRGQERDYNLKVMGTEQLTLPYGMLEGIKVEIVRHNSTRETFAWFSPQLNYQLVRLQQFKDDKEQGDIQLKTFVLTQ